MSDDSSAEDLPDWARKVIARGATCYAVASTTASAISLGHLASAAGHDWARSVLFAVSFECAAAITGTAWVAGRRGGWWFTTGRAATLGLLAGSLVFNAAEVLQVQAKLPAELLLGVAVAVALVFPVGALLFAHLALMVRNVRQAGRPAPEIPADIPAPVPGRDVPPDRAPASPEPPETPDRPETPEPSLYERIVADIRAARAADPPRLDGQRAVAERLGIPRNRPGFADAHRQAKAALEAELATDQRPDQPHNGHRVPLPV